MANQNTINSKSYNIVDVDTNSVPTKVKNQYIPAPVGTQLGGVRQDGTTTLIDPTGTISVNLPAIQRVTSLAVNDTGIPRTGPIRLVSADTSLTLTDEGNGTFLFNVAGSSGGNFMASSVWTGGTATKDAYVDGNVINTQGITISIATTTGSGQITAGVVTLNGIALPNTYTSTGPTGNYTIVIPKADITGNIAQTSAFVSVGLSGNFNGDPFYNVRCGTLMNTQPGVFSATLIASYGATSLPFYTGTTSVSWQYNTVGTVVLPYAGTINDGTPNPFTAATATGQIPNARITGLTFGGTVTGRGLDGGAQVSVPITGSVPAVPTYVPAFWAQTANSTQPAFTSASSQTDASAIGATITYPIASSFFQYNWVCTQRPLANLALGAFLGSSALVPDITGTPVQISGETFSVYGWTSLVPGYASTLIIS